jgi:hypothetical protein
LSEKYPNLIYEIWVTLICGKCFNPAMTYTTLSKNIKIYNISVPTNISSPIYDNTLYDTTIKDLIISSFI